MATIITVIKVNGLYHWYKTDKHGPDLVLENLSLELTPGAITGLVGENGVGKSTLLKLITGLQNTKRGTITTLEGKTLDANDYGFMPERLEFPARVTGREFCRFVYSLYSLGKSYREPFERWASELGIIDAADQKISTYSKGMRQKIGLVSVLMHDPKLLILDEPFSGLDPEARAQFKTKIREVQEITNTTVLLSGHILSDIEFLSQDIVWLGPRELRFHGPMDQLLSRKDRRFELSIQTPDGLLVEEVKLEGLEKRLRELAQTESLWDLRALGNRLESRLYGVE